MALTKILNDETKSYKPVLTDKLVLDTKPTVNSFNGVTSDAVARAVAGASGEVPQVTSSDNGKVLTAVYDAGGAAVEWADAPNEVPAVGENDNAKVLTATYSEGTGSFEWADAPSGVPEYSTAEGGKVLGVVVDSSGEAPVASLDWVDQPANELPAQLGTAGQVLTVNNSETGVEWANPSGSSSAPLPQLTTQNTFRFEFDSALIDPTQISAISSVGTWSKLSGTDKNIWEVTVSHPYYAFQNKLTVSNVGYVKLLDVIAEATDMVSMFEGCDGLTSVNMHAQTGTSARSWSKAFYNCSNLVSINITLCTLSNGVIGNANRELYVSNTELMCKDDRSLNSFTIDSFEHAGYLKMQFSGSNAQAFYNCYNIKNLDIGCFSATSTLNCSRMFSDCRNLVSIPRITEATISYANEMFSGCINLKEFHGTVKITTSAQSMFDSCMSLYYVGTIDLAGITSINSMFKQAYSLSSVNLENTSSVTDMSYLFKNCTGLHRIPTFDVSSVTNANAAFSDMKNAKSGITEMYTALSGNGVISSHSETFTNCGANTVAGTAALSQIPSSWGGTGA